MENPEAGKILEDWEKKAALRTEKAVESLKHLDVERKKTRIESRRANMAKAHVARNAMLARRKLIEEKVRQNQPITEEERDLLHWKAGKVGRKMQQKFMLAAAAKLMIKPQSVSELRLLVETTAAKFAYNPIESLIQQTRDDSIPQKEKIAIHRALLPFLVPQLATPKPVNDGQDAGVKVTVTQFVFPNRPTTHQIHEEKTVMVETTAAPPPEPEHRSDIPKDQARTPLER